MGPKRANLIEEEGCRIRVVHLDRVEKARQEAIPDRELERLALIYRVLGDPTRLRIAIALMGGEMCVCDIAGFLRLSESAVSHQLRRLRDLALVRTRRDGPMLYYSLDDHHVVDLIGLGLEHVQE